MKKLIVSFLLLSLWLSLERTSAWAIDVGWMQQGVRVWYYGAGGDGISSSDAEEAYLFTSISGNTAQLTHNSGINHWSLPKAEALTGYTGNQGPFWIHPQVLQNIAAGNTWLGTNIVSVNRATYTYDTFKNNAEFSAIPYLLLPIKALFDLKPQREIVKLVSGIPYWPGYDVWGTTYFDAETGLCLFNARLTVYNTVFFILSEINYNFANQTAFAEDNGPHTGFKSTVSEQQISSHGINSVFIQSSVETRYGGTVQMWTSTSENGSLPPDENYCFFGSVPVLRHKLMSVAPQYPPENWNAYGQYLWWWVPAGVLQNSTITVFNVPMTRTSTSPYTFTATQQPTGLFYSKLWFDNDGYMTQFAAKDSTTGLDIDPEYTASYYKNDTAVNGLAYYKGTMGNAIPVVIYRHLAMTVQSDTAGKGGGAVNGDGGISCTGHGSDISGMSGNCQADFSSGTIVNLYQTPDSDSIWAAWSVPGCGTSLNCQVLMNGDQNVSVTFPYSFMARVSSTNQGFDSLALAYGNSQPVDTIHVRAVTFTENFIPAGNKVVTLLGGRDAWYQPQNSWTTLQGVLTIQGGSLAVERVVIK